MVHTSGLQSEVSVALPELSIFFLLMKENSLNVEPSANKFSNFGVEGEIK